MPEETEYGYGALVTVSAAPAEGWRFLQWQSGTEVMSLSPDYRFAITEHTQLTAVFEEDPAAHPLRVHVLGRGRVDRGAGNADSAIAYAHGTTVDLHVVPEDGWVFDRWDGDAVIDAQHSADAAVHMDGPKAVMAVFKAYVDISVDLNDDGVYLAEDGLHTHPDDEALEDTEPELMRTEDGMTNRDGRSQSRPPDYYVSRTQLLSYTPWRHLTDDYQPIHVYVSPDLSPKAVIEVSVDAHNDSFAFHPGPSLSGVLQIPPASPFPNPWPLAQGRFPSTIYVTANNDLADLGEAPTVTLTVTVRDATIPAGEASDSILLKIVRKVGDSDYFGAARDYLREHPETRLFCTHEIFEEAGAVEDYFLVAMPQELVTLGTCVDEFPRGLFGIMDDDRSEGYDVIVNANYFKSTGKLIGYVITGGLLEKLSSPMPSGTPQSNYICQKTLPNGALAPVEFGDLSTAEPALYYPDDSAFDWNSAADWAGVYTNDWKAGVVGLYGVTDNREANFIGQADTSNGPVLFLAMTANGPDIGGALGNSIQGITMTKSFQALMKDKLVDSGASKCYRLDGGSSCAMYLRPLDGWFSSGVQIAYGRHQRARLLGSVIGYSPGLTPPAYLLLSVGTFQE